MNDKTLTTTQDDAAREFTLVCQQVNKLNLIENVNDAFGAAIVVSKLRAVLTDGVMNTVFMPLMNTKVGFLTDRTGKERNGKTLPVYSVDIVRDALIDAICIGLAPTGNQFNIIAERMYPTKEGFAALLRNLGCKSFFYPGIDKGTYQGHAEIPVRINYEYKGEKKEFQVIATVKKDSYSSHDQLRGKAERRAKKALYEYLTGRDFGDADENSSAPIDIMHSEVSNKKELGPVPMTEAGRVDIGAIGQELEETRSVKHKTEQKLTIDPLP